MDQVARLAVVFYEEAREVSIGNKRSFGAAPDDLIKIARSPAGQAEFARCLRNTHDPELREQIVQFVSDLADSFDEDVMRVDRKIELIDRAGLTIAGSVTVTGIGGTMTFLSAAAASGSILGPMGLLLGGLTGLIVVASGRYTLKRRSDDSRSLARKLRRLIGK